MLLYQNTINTQKERKTPIGDNQHGCYNQCAFKSDTDISWLHCISSAEGNHSHLKDPALGHHFEVTELIFCAKLVEVTYNAVTVSFRLHFLRLRHVLKGDLSWSLLAKQRKKKRRNLISNNKTVGHYDIVIMYVRFQRLQRISKNGEATPSELDFNCRF